jgi:hypothetical protein
MQTGTQGACQDRRIRNFFLANPIRTGRLITELESRDMKVGLGFILFGLTLMLPAAARADDVDTIYRIGQVVKDKGAATDFSVSGWNHYLDVNIGSMLPGDARDLADAMCGAARGLSLKAQWTVRVFLVVGQRPAATCTAG